MPRPRYSVPYEESISLPVIIIDNPTMVNLITHLSTHCISVTPATPGIAAPLSFAWYGMPDAQWERLLAVAPQLSYT